MVAHRQSSTGRLKSLRRAGKWPSFRRLPAVASASMSLPSQVSCSLRFGLADVCTWAVTPRSVHSTLPQPLPSVPFTSFGSGGHFFERLPSSNDVTWFPSKGWWDATPVLACRRLHSCSIHWRDGGCGTRPRACRAGVPLGPLGCECAQHRPTPRPSVERICREALFSDLEDPAQRRWSRDLCAQRP